MGLQVITSPGGGSGAGLPADVALAAANTLLVGSKVTADAVDRFTITADGTHSWGGGALAADLTAARSAAGILAVGGALTATGDISARLGVASQVKVGAFGPASESAITLGSAADATLYRSAAAVLRTAGGITADLNIIARNAASAQVKIGAFGPASEAALTFGSATDIKLYRESSATARTNANIGCEQAVSALYASADQVTLGLYQNGAVSWGSAQDTVLQKRAVGVLAVQVNANQCTAPTMTGPGFMLGNVTVAPSTNPVGGGTMYCQAGALKYIGTAGTITTIAVA